MKRWTIVVHFRERAASGEEIEDGDAQHARTNG